MSTLISLAACGLYALSCRQGTPSRMLTLQILLVSTDGLISIGLLIYLLLDAADVLNDEKLCDRYFVLSYFLYLMSFGWTSLIAQRFKDTEVMNIRIRTYKPFSLWIVPLLSGLFALPFIFFNSIGGDLHVNEVQYSPRKDDRDYCFFASSTNAFITNIFFLQIPSVITCVFNVVCYRTGTKAMKESSPSVVSFIDR